MTKLLPGRSPDVGNDRLAIFVNPLKNDEGVFGRIGKLLRVAQSQVKKDYNVSLTAAVSSRTDDYQNLSRLYDECNGILVTHMSRGMGRSCFLKTVRSHAAETSLSYRYDLQKRVIEEIRSGDADGLAKALNEVLGEIRNQDYANIRVSIIFLVNSIQNEIQELSTARLKSSNASFRGGDLLDRETIDEFYSATLDAIAASGVLQRDSITHKHAILVENVKDFIQARYSDSSLCLSQVASTYKMSESHLAKVFRESVHMSIFEYINEVRLGL